MKRILLVMCLFISSISIITAQDLKEIRGSKSVKSGTKETYCIAFAAPLKVMTKIKIAASHGKINSSTNSNFEEITVNKDNSDVEFSVYWDDVVASDAFITAYKSEEKSTPVELKNIKITKEGTSSDESTTMTPYIKTSIKHGFSVSDDIITFEVGNLGADNYDIEKWIYDSNVFQEISRNYKSITLKARQITTDSKRVQVGVRIKYTYYGVFGISLAGNKATHTYGFTLYNKPYIKNKDNIICSGNTNYEIINPVPYTKTSVQWTAGENLKFISSVNPFQATFLSTGKGKTKAIATVKLEGSGNMADFKREFKIENSNVWVGVPPKTAPLTLSPTVGCGTQATFRIPNSMPEGAFNETSVNWKSSVTPSSKTKTDLKVFAKYAGSIIDASMDLTNKCGTSRSNTATIVVTGNCGTIDPERPGKPGQPGLDPELRAKNNSRLNSYLPITSVKVYVYPTGSLVYQKKNVVNFDIQNTTLGEGIYILEITDQEGNVTREKVMKSKQ